MTNGWTSDKPTEEGWYWLRYKNNTRPSVHQVVRDDDGDGKGRRLWVVLGEDSRMPVATYDEQYTWIGPITPGDRAAGRVEGLREAAKIANTRQGWHGELIANQIEQAAQGEGGGMYMIYRLDQVLGMIREACAQAGSQYQWATMHKLSPSYVSDVLKGRRNPGTSLLKALRLEAVTQYREVR